MKPPLVSVVTPFYNGVDYLRACMESVLRQDYPNFEYIVQDNCSDDGASRIAEELARKDPRIRLFRNDKLLGQVPNYNLAITRCSPESTYIKLAQADDWLLPGCLSEMVAAGERNPSAAVVAAHYHLGDSIGATPLPTDQELFSGRDIVRRQLLEDCWYFGSPTTVMYRAAPIRQRPRTYWEGRYHEDTDLCYELMREHDLAFCHKILTAVRTDNPSIKTRTASFNAHALDRLIQVETHGKFFLTEAEFAKTRKRIMSDYYAALSSRALRGAPTGFWAYHERGLAMVHLKIETWRLFVGAARRLRKLLFNPGQTAATLINAHIRRNTGRSA